jgi:hypothetical protein
MPRLVVIEGPVFSIPIRKLRDSGARAAGWRSHRTMGGRLPTGLLGNCKTAFDRR